MNKFAFGIWFPHNSFAFHFNYILVCRMHNNKKSLKLKPRSYKIFTLIIKLIEP